MITCKSEISERQLLQAMRVHFRTATHEKWILPLCGIILLVIFGNHIAQDPSDWQNYSFILLAILGFTIPLWRIPLLKRNIRQMPNYGKTVDWNLDQKSIQGKGEGFTFSLDWPTICSATISKNGILIYPQKKLFYWLPAESFSSQDDFNLAIDIVVSSVKKTKMSKQVLNRTFDPSGTTSG